MGHSMQYREDHRVKRASLIAIVIGLFWTAWHSLFPDHFLAESRLTTLIDHLSIALVVAGVLGVTIDTYLKRALIRDVGAIFIGWALPQEVRNYIREASQTAIVLRNYQAHYSLTIVGNEVVIDVTYSWDVYNYSTGRQKYVSGLAEDRHERPEVEAIRCELTKGGKKQVWDYDKFMKGKKLHPSRRDAFEWRTPGMWLGAQDANDPNTRPACHVRWYSRLRLPQDYSTVISFARATLHVKVTAACPKDLVFGCDHEHDTRDTSDGVSEWVNCAPRIGPPIEASYGILGNAEVAATGRLDLSR
jgi:hypothetical protein